MYQSERLILPEEPERQRAAGGPEDGGEPVPAAEGAVEVVEEAVAGHAEVGGEFLKDAREPDERERREARDGPGTCDACGRPEHEQERGDRLRDHHAADRPRRAADVLLA